MAKKTKKVLVEVVDYDVTKITPRMYEVIKRLLVTEKSKTTELLNIYTFEVDKNANKTEVKMAVQAIFGVKVERVNMLKARPQRRRVGRHTGIVPGFKKAMVKLAPGYELDVAKRLS